MKWVTLLKDFKDKVGLTQITPVDSSSSPFKETDANESPYGPDFSISASGANHGLELEFMRYWEEFHTSSSEKEKEKALNWTVETFCQLVAQCADVSQIINRIVEIHKFSFVIGRAFVTHIEKLKLISKTRVLEYQKLLLFFTETTQDGVRHGANLLNAVEVLVSGLVDKQSLLDSGVLCCLIHVLYALLAFERENQGQNLNKNKELELADENHYTKTSTLEVAYDIVECSVINIMKALANHSSSARSLAEDDSLQLLFQMVANGSLVALSLYKKDSDASRDNLHRNAMQILGVILAGDNGSTTKYIHKHYLIKVLLMVVKDFNQDRGDPDYTMGIVDLLHECVKLSYRQEAGGIRFQKDIHNAQGYQILVQFALTLSKNQIGQAFQCSPFHENDSSADRLPSAEEADSDNYRDNGNFLPQNNNHTICRLLDVIVNLAQVGTYDAPGSSYQKYSQRSRVKPYGNGRNLSPSSEIMSGDIQDNDNERIKDLEAVRMLQDILIQAKDRELQFEVLNRLFKVFSCHLENYQICQQLKILPLLILNMSSFFVSLQETVFKILEYVVSIVGIIPEQELLTLCCLLQQPITSKLKHMILSFFVKLLSFDQQYKRILREVGLLEVLIDDLSKCKFLLRPIQLSGDHDQCKKKSSSGSSEELWDSNDSFLSLKHLEDDPRNTLLFEVEDTISVAWDCLVSLVKKEYSNQATLRAANWVAISFSFLASSIHRSGVLRVISCLISEDYRQVHPEELKALVEVMKSGMVTGDLGTQFSLHNDAKCEIFEVLWRILKYNVSAQRVFGEADGFSLLLTTLEYHMEQKNRQYKTVYIQMFTYVLRVITAGVHDFPANRSKLHALLSSQTFYDLFCKSKLICDEFECQVIQLLLELSLEIVLPPRLAEKTASIYIVENESTGSILNMPSSSFCSGKERVYNAAAIMVLIRSLHTITPKLQQELLNLIGKLACSSPFNQENLTSVGCVELLLEAIYPLMLSSSPSVSHALRIVEALGAYRLSASELATLVRYALQMRRMSSGHCLVQMMERLIHSVDTSLGHFSLAPFVEMNMNKVGHASIQVPLGERSWPPTAGYSFVCWFQFQNLLKAPAKYTQASKVGTSNKHSKTNGNCPALQIFSVGAVDKEGSLYTELLLKDDGVLVLATSSSSSLSFPELEMDEGRWHHLAVVHSKPNALAGLFQASVAYVYLNGKLRHTGKLGYSVSPTGKPLQVTIGTEVACIKKKDWSWKLRSCYLFEEVVSPGSVWFMYILGKGYKGLFQDSNLLQFVPYQARGGDSMSILDSFDADLPLSYNTQNAENPIKQWIYKAGHRGIVWDYDKLRNLSMQLRDKKMIFAFDGGSTEILRGSEILSMLNLVDPLSAAASPIGGIPHFGRLVGDVHVCMHSNIGETIHQIGGLTVVLALVEAAETRDMLRMSLALLACALHQNPQNVRDMKKNKGYHLLALFLLRKMSMFDLQSLEIFFQIAACEATFLELGKIGNTFSAPSRATTIGVTKSEDSLNVYGMENAELLMETSEYIVLSNADMIEHVLLDWTIWVNTPVQIQITLLGFLENLVSMHLYRNHNLEIFRRINLAQHLLVTLQRNDVEVPVLEKLVVLLGVILEDGFLPSELELVVRFVIMTFDPPELVSRHYIMRESMGKHVIVRNMLLEMLIDLQVTIQTAELLEQWNKLVSSKLITYFLDEAVHPTSMRWIMTLLGVCLTSSHTFALKFRSSGAYLILERVLPHFYDAPDLYYIIFCLMLEKPVYPRLPEVSMLNFLALMPNNGSSRELKFVELLNSIIAMAKSTFDSFFILPKLAYQIACAPVAELLHRNIGILGETGNELKYKTYTARFMGGEAPAPEVAASVLIFVADLAKSCPPFSEVCRRPEFLESCVELYYSCVRAAQAVKLAKELTVETNYENLKDSDDTSGSRGTFLSFPQENEVSGKISIPMGTFPHGHASSDSEDVHGLLSNMSNDKRKMSDVKTLQESNISVNVDAHADASVDYQGMDRVLSVTSSGDEFNFHDTKSMLDETNQDDSQSSMKYSMLDTTNLSENCDSSTPLTPSLSTGLVLTSYLDGASLCDSKALQESNSHMKSAMPADKRNISFDLMSDSQTQNTPSTLSTISPKLLLEMDESGYEGGPCSAGATAILDFMAEVFSDIVIKQMRAAAIIEIVLDSITLYMESEPALIFQGLCLSKLMKVLKRCLLCDDGEKKKKLRSINLDALSCMIVDRVCMGAFPSTSEVLKTLEFLLSMVYLLIKDDPLEETSLTGSGLISIGRGNNQVDACLSALFKNVNRMILFCFLPSFFFKLGEDRLLQYCFDGEQARVSSSSYSQENGGIDVFSVLQLLIDHRQLIFCPSNLDKELILCLCLNLISLLRDQRQNVQNMAANIFRYLLLHCRVVLEDFFVSKPNGEPSLNVLFGGFDKLLNGNFSEFLEWFQSSERLIHNVTEQGAGIIWRQYITVSKKFLEMRLIDMVSHRKKEMDRKSRDVLTIVQNHWEQVNKRRIAVELSRDSMATELRVIHQDKYGWILHAESEWENHLQQLVHERVIFPNGKFMNKEDLQWQLCPIEGPYRMRRKLERCKLKIGTIENLLNNQIQLSGELSKQKTVDEYVEDVPRDGIFSPKPSNESTVNESVASNIACTRGGCNDYDESIIYDAGFQSAKEFNMKSISTQKHEINDVAFQSAAEFGMRSSSVSSQEVESIAENLRLGSPKQSSSSSINDAGESAKELLDNGEYLIRPYLEPFEQIKYKYNCERIVGLDKHDGIFLIGELSLYVIENFYVNKSGRICEKEREDDLSIIDQALGVKKISFSFTESQLKSSLSWGATVKEYAEGLAWTHNGDEWRRKVKVGNSSAVPHLWHMWKLDCVHELLKRDYQLRPVAIEIFSMNGCTDLLVFHKSEREKVFKNLVSMDLPRNSILDTTSGSTEQDGNEGNSVFKVLAKSFSKRWQQGEISNFQYIMHLNTLAGRGYSDLTQYPVFPWILADYESENLDLSNRNTFRKLEKPMGCQTSEGEEEFRRRFYSWDDPEVPKFHYGSHYSSAGIVLFYLLRLPPFSIENQKLQGGQFDHADRLFSSIRDTWMSASGKSNTSDVKELIPEFFYMPEFLENRFGLDLGEKQSGEKIGDVVLPPWAKGSAREFIRKHREALESDHVSEHLHHWIDLIFGYKQRGKAAEEAVNVFYHYTYGGGVDIDSVTDSSMKASILAQINNFGQTPKQLFLKPHVKRQSGRKLLPYSLEKFLLLVPHEIRRSSSSISQIYTFGDKILTAGANRLLKPRTFDKYVAWGFPDHSLRFMSYDHNRLLSTHENLHGSNQIQCASASHDGKVLVTGGDDGMVCVWKVGTDSHRAVQRLELEKALCSHTQKITCLQVSQPYMMIVSGSHDCTVVIWDLSSLVFVRQLPKFPTSVSGIYVNDMTGEIVTAAGVILAVWSINGDCLAVVDTSQLQSDTIRSLTACTFSDWHETNWYVSGHQSGAVKIWRMVHRSGEDSSQIKVTETGSLGLGKIPEYKLILHKAMMYHLSPVSGLHFSSGLKQLFSGDSDGHLISWASPDDSFITSITEE